MTARDAYRTIIQSLPPLERLHVAALILDELTGAGGSAVDVSDSWTDQDIAELGRYSLESAAHSEPHEGSDD